MCITIRKYRVKDKLHVKGQYHENGFEKSTAKTHIFISGNLKNWSSVVKNTILV